jgi:hypothetical protein
MDSRSLIEQAFKQGKQLDSLAQRTFNVQASQKEAIDRVYYSIQDSFTFQQGQNIVQSLVFNVPQSDDFEAVRISLYPSVRRVTSENLSTGQTNDLAFRQTFWAYQYYSAAINSSVDALVELTATSPNGKTRAYQNAAFFASQMFSGYTSPLTLETFSLDLQAFDRSESPSALVFDPSWYFVKGSTLSARVTLLFSGERNPALSPNGFVNEYQIRGVLEGFKRSR